MAARWLMVLIWTVIAGVATSLIGATLFVWLAHLLFRPGPSHSATAADALFYGLAVGLPSVATCWVLIRGCRGKLPGTERDGSY